MRAVLRRIFAAAIAAASVVGAQVASATADASGPHRPPAVSAADPCVGLSGASSRIHHVIVLFMENQPYDAIIGSDHAPYVNDLVRRCGVATNYHNITHPSAPEYLAATSGEPGGARDCPPVFLDPSRPPTCPDSNDNIFHQATIAGATWKNYEEGMATNCFEGEDSSNYDINHNPAAYYTDLGGPSGDPKSLCARFDVPMGTPQAGNFESDLRSGRLPNYSFIAPDLIHDTHNSTVAVGDAYLAQLMPTIFNSAEYRSGSTVLFLAWDEGEGGSVSDCAYNTADVGCHVAMVVASPYTRPGTLSDRLFNHYALLKTSEQLLGLPLLGHAKDPTVKSMAFAFHL
jgi:phosphatidylinositol-3-phosphatase